MIAFFPEHISCAVCSVTIITIITITIPPTRTLAYQQSYFPGTIKQWNNLPNHIIDTESLEQFNNCIFGLDLL